MARGGQVMVQEGIMDRFDIKQVYGIHNAPNLPFGHFYTTPGALMASVDTAFVYITGKGGHGATPHECIDPVVATVGQWFRRSRPSSRAMSMPWTRR